jgi:hypothetical protein
MEFYQLSISRCFTLRYLTVHQRSGRHSQIVLERVQPATVVGLVPQLGMGTVEGQDPQVVHVKGTEVAGDHVVECHGWTRGV